MIIEVPPERDAIPTMPWGFTAWPCAVETGDGQKLRGVRLRFEDGVDWFISMTMLDDLMSILVASAADALKIKLDEN